MGIFLFGGLEFQFITTLVSEVKPPIITDESQLHPQLQEIG